jgi:mycothiol system anti-sigma-R factor
MNCLQAIEQLWQYLDHELDGESSSQLESHLRQCRECFSKAEFERQLRAMLRRSCGGEQAPPRLRERLSKLLRMY